MELKGGISEFGAMDCEDRSCGNAGGVRKWTVRIQCKKRFYRKRKEKCWVLEKVRETSATRDCDAKMKR